MVTLSISEFKAWLDGFSQSINVSPTKEQWELIKKKMDEIVIDSKYIPMPIYVRDPAPSYPIYPPVSFYNGHTTI